jgi:hypothetical protein
MFWETRMTRLLALVIAGAVAVPLMPAFAEDDTVGVGTAQGIPEVSNAERSQVMPAIPYINEMLYLNSQALLGPKLDTIRPFMVDAAALWATFPATFADRFPDTMAEDHLKTE